MVGVTRFELVASSVSGKRSPPELNARLRSAAFASAVGKCIRLSESVKTFLDQIRYPRFRHHENFFQNFPCIPFLVGLVYLLADADMAQLVEHHLAKVGVAGSNPVVRSRMLEAGQF